MDEAEISEAIPRQTRPSFGKPSLWGDEDLLPISGLQHLTFCERQWALITLEREWRENSLTVEGKKLHRLVHEQTTDVRAGIRLTRALRLRSLALGLYGVADLVEFHPCGEGVKLPGVSGTWLPYPVEYKRGRKRFDHADEIQLCAQGLCLEEMLNIQIQGGALYYGQPRRRFEVAFSSDLRAEVEKKCSRAREICESGVIPQPDVGSHCSNCSLEDVCMPDLTVKDQSARYLGGIMEELLL